MSSISTPPFIQSFTYIMDTYFTLWFTLLALFFQCPRFDHMKQEVGYVLLSPSPYHLMSSSYFSFFASQDVPVSFPHIFAPDPKISNFSKES